MNKTNLDIIEVSAYYENARISSKKAALKIAVLKVRYQDGTWDTIFRGLINHKMFNINNYVEEYKGIGLNQVIQLLTLNDKDEQKISELYLKKYLENDLNMVIAKNNLKLYVQDKTEYVISKTKYIYKKVRTFEKQLFATKKLNA